MYLLPPIRFKNHITESPPPKGDITTISLWRECPKSAESGEGGSLTNPILKIEPAKNI